MLNPVERKASNNKEYCYPQSLHKYCYPKRVNNQSIYHSMSLILTKESILVLIMQKPSSVTLKHALCNLLAFIIDFHFDQCFLNRNSVISIQTIRQLIHSFIRITEEAVLTTSSDISQ